MLISSLFQCHFDYACSAWYSGLTVKLKSKLQVTQNRAIRYMLNLPPRAHVGRAEFNKVGLLPVNLRVDQLKLSQMFNIIHGSAPSSLSTHITMVHTQHHRNTRAIVNSCSVPKVNSVVQSSFFYTGISLLNDLPRSVRAANTKSAFKRRVQNHLNTRVVI